jgi:broad specificity phosphatase PhoE
MFLLGRHARSLVNDDYTLAQRMAEREIGLSELGMNQSVDMGKEIFKFVSETEVSVETVNFIVSPYKRAKETAEIAIKQNTYGINISYQVSPLIHEKGLGKFEGYDLENIVELFGKEAAIFLTEYRDYEKKYDARPPHRIKGQGFDHDHHGESYRDANLRAKEFLENVEFFKNSDDKTLNVIIAHGRFNTFIEKELMNIDEEDYLSIPIYNNCALKYFSLNKKNDLFEDQGLIFSGFENKNERAMEKFFKRGQTPLHK